MPASDVSKRKTYSTAVIRIAAFVNTNLQNATAAEVEAKLDSLEYYWHKFCDYQCMIEGVCGPEELPFQQNEMVVIEDEYHTTKASLLTKRQSFTAVAPLSTTTSSPSTPNASVNMSQIPLPRMEIPRFSGNYVQWMSFRDLFNSLVHTKPGLSDAQKLQYLKTCMDGEAAQLLRNYQVTDANYLLAITALKERYENVRLIVHGYLKRLFNQPVMQSECGTALRNLVDTTSEVISALKSLKIDTSSWDPILVFIVVQRLNTTTARDWEHSLKAKDLPSLKQLMSFIETRCRSIETIEVVTPKKNVPPRDKRLAPDKRASLAFHSTSKTPTCPVCNDSHWINQCTTFLNLNVPARTEVIKNKHLRFNCFQGKHSSRNCNSGKCRICSRKHNTLIHPSSQEQQPSSQSTTSSTDESVTAHHSTQQLTTVGSEPAVSTVLLATACVNTISSDGTRQRARVLLDSGSQASFISEECVSRLKLQRTKISINVNGLGTSKSGTARGMVHVNLSSTYDPTFEIIVGALIINRITSYLPDKLINMQQFTELNKLELADKHYFQPGKIDILLGADIYGQLILDGIVRGTQGTPFAQRTTFGWVLSGPVSSKTQYTHETTSSTTNLHAHLDLDRVLKSFWELENISHHKNLTPEESFCEMHFENTHERDKTGRYIVQLPIGDKGPALGNSKLSAISRFNQLERRFQRNPELTKGYVNFMNEYLQLHHMDLASPSNEELSYYIPHHPVFKHDSTSTKLRVVFDASNKSSSGTSLNDILMVGPKIQDDLYEILLRFRKHRIGITADISKMYRQIKVNPKHINLQRIIWRSDPTEPLNEYCLNTVTYGTAAAPFLAIRALQQCAIDEKLNFPDAYDVVMHDFYVDDLITGADDESEALVIQQQVKAMLQSGGFPLCKWASNSTKILEAVIAEEREISIPLEFSTDDSIKTLGVKWYPSADEFQFKVKLYNIHVNYTKRLILAEIGKLYDPIGWLAPVVIKAKILMQELWLSGLNWDEEIPNSILQSWLKIQIELPVLENIRIPRWLQTTKERVVQLHGFSDASESAYSAVIYARTNTEDGKVKVIIVTSKTRVAPVQQVTLPRLELCGAVLLARLLRSVKLSLKLGEDVKCYAWTDSSIVLSWLRKLPNNWKTFVANRVSTIQEILDPEFWNYVPSKQNPADCASRGIFPSELLTNELWWHGPSWLKDVETSWPKCPTKINRDTNLEERTKSCTTTHITINQWDLLERYSSLNRLKRITAYIQRFLHNIKTTNERRTGLLTPSELQAALLFWIKEAQTLAYPQEVKCIEQNQKLPRRSELLSLNPFIDPNGLLRVGGRIAAAAGVSQDLKNPIILPSNCKIMFLIVSDIHLSLEHGGTQLMLTQLRERYWLPRARRMIRSHIHSCLRCFRQKRQTSGQIMGNLPAARITPARPFLNSGVDYAGPINIRVSKLRNSKTSKAYIAVFVCLVTRALHLELVSDLSTDAFLAAFRRFVGRRGRCAMLMSDNGTNFIGAKNTLHELYSIIHGEAVPNQLANSGTTWRLIPPSAPHQGGIWEAGVRSVKHHLRRVVGIACFNFEELTTILVQIEACLNSRPLAALSDDPNDTTALTPGHFLIGEPIMSIPDPDVIYENISYLKRWQLVQRTQREFWHRWQGEYISELQQRTKWTDEKPNLERDDLVIVKDEQLPPTSWSLARITDVHPGVDGMVRVVSIKLNNKIVKRPIHKLCLIPRASGDISETF